MFRDRSLIPSEAVRLLTLGLLAEQPRSYAALAAEIRQTISHLVGPSLDLLAPPLEILKVEGQVDSHGEGSDAILSLTPVGKAKIAALLSAPLRSPSNDLSRLVLALKLRFLHFLPLEEQRLQLEALAEAAERELTRLDAMAAETAQGGLFAEWLDQERAQARSRAAWLRGQVR